MDPSRERDFTAFYDATWPRTVACAYALTGDLGEAQDLAQEAYSRAWPRWSSLHGYDDPGAWVRHVATRLAVSRWRRARTAAVFLAHSRARSPQHLHRRRPRLSSRRSSSCRRHSGGPSYSTTSASSLSSRSPGSRNAPRGRSKRDFPADAPPLRPSSLPRTENTPMPDLDQLLDTLVADVSTGTRAPGAQAAIKRAHQRRGKIAAAAAAASVVFIAVGGGLAAENLGGSDRVSPVGEPTPAASDPPTVPESAEESPGSDEFFRTELQETLAHVPGWAITDSDPTILHPCGGAWSSSATGGSGGTIPPGVWADEVGFPSAAHASDATALLAANLASCTAVAWSTQPIAQTGAVLASSATGVIWIHQKGATVATLQVPTTDGPPPLGVQVEVADLIRLSIG